jgi:hypothetical protein
VTLGRLARSESFSPRAADDATCLLERKHLVAEL